MCDYDANNISAEGLIRCSKTNWQRRHTVGSYVTRGLREVGFLNLGSWPLPAPASSPHSPIRSPKHLFGVIRVFGVTQGPVICADGPLGFCVEYGSRGRDQMLALLSACANLWPCLQLGCRPAASKLADCCLAACWLPHPTRTLASVSRGVSKVPP